MMKIKKMTTTLALALTLLIGSSLTAPKADAGILTMAGGIASNNVAGVVTGGFVTWAGFAIADMARTNPWGFVGFALIVLDANQPLTNDGIEQFIAKKYPFIDDREVISDLATLVKTKIVSSGALNTSMNVRIPAIEVRKILANTSLSEEQSQMIVTALE